MSNFLSEIDGFETNNVYYIDTYSLFCENKHCDVLDKAKLVGQDICEGEIDHENSGVFSDCF